MTRGADAFMLAVTAPDPRQSLKVDRLLAEMDDTTAAAVRDALANRAYSTARLVAGFAALGSTISASSIDTWRRKHGH